MSSRSRAHARSTYSYDLGLEVQEMRQDSKEKKIREIEALKERYGAPPVAPRSSERRDELSRDDQTENLREETRHRVTFEYQQADLSLSKMTCTCGWVGMPSRWWRDLVRVDSHFMRVVIRETEQERQRQARAMMAKWQTYKL